MESQTKNPDAGSLSAGAKGFLNSPGPATETPFTRAVPSQSEFPEEVILLEPGQEKAQTIVKAISNQNAGELLQVLSGGPMKLSDIASRLGMSINAAKYHIDNLADAGLIEVADTRYSVKGRKIKIYRLKNQVYIVAPRATGGTDLRTMLLKYAAGVGIFMGLFLALFYQPFLAFPETSVSLSGALGSTQAAEIPGGYPVDIVAPLVIAGVVTLILLALYETYVARRQKLQAQE
ncbi:MAG: helix-turn-helix domain-containing protein [Methanoregulaceae archaeon]